MCRRILNIFARAVSDRARGAVVVGRQRRGVGEQGGRREAHTQQVSDQETSANNGRLEE